MTTCQARPDRYGSIRCTACRVSWDRDDVAACPRQVVPVVPPAEVYVSALAPSVAHSASVDWLKNRKAQIAANNR